jgi:lipopolysaccharide/colanic/teichoic acid biosynthesis glycosyltransferase
MIIDMKNYKPYGILLKIITTNNFFYRIVKRLFDIIISIILLPIMLCIYSTLFFFNAFFNKGKVFYIQERMGKNCKPFKCYKFRTMYEADEIIRGHADPLEYERITSIGHFLRATRLDEIPQIINVIRGDMSLIGPRPDYYNHALIFLKEINNYKYRHSVRPGISGLSQIRHGYAEGIKATKVKSTIDIYYINNASILLDTRILFGTLYTIIIKAGN